MHESQYKVLRLSSIDNLKKLQQNKKFIINFIYKIKQNKIKEELI